MYQAQLCIVVLLGREDVPGGALYSGVFWGKVDVPDPPCMGLLLGREEARGIVLFDGLWGRGRQPYV